MSALSDSKTTVRPSAAHTEEGSFLSHRHIDVSVLAEQACPVAEVIDHVSGRWTVGILTAAAQGPVRFVELERSVRGISRRMLTLKLRQLERDGLLTRTVFPIVPPHVEYTLTEIAAELLETLQGLTGWAIRHRGTVAEARAAYDRAHGEAEHPL
jgi:DNA-binding HxlR family transcriptional regulator